MFDRCSSLNDQRHDALWWFPYAPTFEPRHYSALARHNDNGHDINSAILERDNFSTLCFDHTSLHTGTKMVDWKSLGEKKRDSINALIPKAWLLPSAIPPATEQRDVTGKYIQQYLDAREIEITETDAVGIVKNTTSGAWKAREVAEAFCHRAALAHQLVSQHGTFSGRY